MPDTFDGLKCLQGHLKALQGLHGRMEPKHIARGTIEGRIEECKQAIRAERKARERKVA